MVALWCAGVALVLIAVFILGAVYGRRLAAKAYAEAENMKQRVERL